MPDETNDVKPLEETSSVSTTEQTDVNTESPPASSAGEQASTGQGENDLLSQVKAMIKDKASQAEKDDKETEEVPKEDSTEEESTETETTEEAVDPTKPIPYERFKEVNEARTVLEKNWTAAQPVIEAQHSITEFCQSNNISPQEFEYWLNVAALAKTDPAKAKEFLKPELEKLDSFTGDRLSPELTAAVENGEISLDWAKKIAASESKALHAQKSQKFTVEQQIQQKQQEFSQQLDNGLKSWIQQKQAKIPNFKPKASEDKPDGLMELWSYKFVSAAKTAKINSPADLLAIADKTLSDLQASLKGFSPKPKTPPRMSSTQASPANDQSKPKSIMDIARNVCAKQGISIT